MPTFEGRGHPVYGFIEESILASHNEIFLFVCATGSLLSMKWLFRWYWGFLI